jgi:hemolysin activation/secretion protein
MAESSRINASLWRGCAGAAVAAAWAGPALAQTAPTREEVLRPPPVAAPEAPVAPVEGGDDSIERAPCPLADPQFANVTFTLNAVQFSGTEAIDRSLLDPAWRDRVGTTVPVAAICDIRDRAAAILRDEGYLAAVRVPVQTIEGGNVTLDILAARLTGVQVRGTAGPSEGVLARYLGKLTDQPLFNTRSAERYLLLANSLPGINGRLTLRPGGAPGDVVGEVIVARTPAALDINIQNYGSQAIGRFGGIVRARVNGITGMGDETTLGYYATADFREQHVVQGGHEFRIGGEGLTFATTATYAWTRPTIAANPGLKTRTFVSTTSLRYPVTLTQSHSLWASAGFDYVDQDVDILGVPLNQDHLRVAWAAVDASWFDPSAFSGRGGYSPAEPAWSFRISLSARQGLDVFGASPDCSSLGLACFAPGATPTSRFEGDPTAYVARGEADLTIRPNPNFTVAITPRAQYSRKALLSYEEFSAGNFTVGRGYDPGTLTGDSGVGYSIEARVGSLVPRTRQSITIQPFAFVDAAWVWNRDSSFAGLNPQQLHSAGGGARIAFGDVARIDMTVARRLRSTLLQPDRGPVRLLVSFTMQLGVGR